MKELLLKLGLTARESEAYLALAKVGTGTASQISRLAKEHRSNVYDSLHSLAQKGLISYCVKSNVTYYSYSDPQKLIEFVQEKEEVAHLAVETLRKQAFIPAKPIVEVYEGIEGYKSILSLILRCGKTIHGLGASDQWQKQIPIFMKQYMRQRESKKIKAKLLYISGTRPIRHALNEIRFIDTKFAQPATITIFDDYVAVFLWSEPLVATLTHNKKLAKSYLKYFDLLWASPKTK